MRDKLTREIDMMALEEFVFWVGFAALVVAALYGLFRIASGDLVAGAVINLAVSGAAILWPRILARAFG